MPGTPDFDAVVVGWGKGGKTLDEQTSQILGATLFCTDSQEIINLIALAIRHQVPYTALRDGIYTHPSSTEALNEVLGTI